jgi:hypothetical protein
MGAADRRRIKKDPRAERIKQEIGAQLAGVMRPPGRPRARSRNTTTAGAAVSSSAHASAAELSESSARWKVRSRRA